MLNPAAAFVGMINYTVVRQQEELDVPLSHESRRAPSFVHHYFCARYTEIPAGPVRGFKPAFR